MLFVCPKCRQELAGDETLAGRILKCPACHVSILLKAVGVPPTTEGAAGKAPAAATAPVAPAPPTPRRTQVIESSSTEVSKPSHSRPTVRRLVVAPPEAASDEAALDYEILALVGEDEEGAVYLARQLSLDRNTVVKTIQGRAARDAKAVEGFVNEAIVTAALDHPNIVPVYDLGFSEEGTPFYSMKYIVGQPWSKTRSEKTLDENLGILLRVADAVAFAHSRGVIHRDLKPANVMLGDYGEVLVVDWGLAAGMGGTDVARRIAPGREIVGTPAYMPPEMALGQVEKMGVGTDVYLLGAALYEILTGSPPHRAGMRQDYLRCAAENRVQPPSGGGALAGVAMKAMATEPGERYASVREFQAAILACQEHRESAEMARLAVEDLDKAGVAQDYRLYSRAAFGFEQALKLWPSNQYARKMLHITGQRHALCAIARGDLDLAESLLIPGEPPHDELRIRLDALRRERLASEEKRQRKWILVFEDGFSDPERTARDWDMVTIGGTWEVKDGELRMANGTPQMAILKRPLSGDIRIEFDCHQESDYLCDVSCFLSARRNPDAPGAGSAVPLRGGYAFKYGCYSNTRNVIEKNWREFLWAENAKPLGKHHRYHVCAEKMGNRLTLTVDGVRVVEMTDADPFDGADRATLGLLGHGADTYWDNFQVFRMGEAEVSDLLDVGDRHLEQGSLDVAQELYWEVLASSADSARRERCQRGLDRAAAAAQHRQRLPEVDAHIRAAWPGANVQACNTGYRVDISGCGVTDLSPLSGLPVVDLKCGRNAITDLTPLRGMRLTTLDCHQNRIADLEPLRGMPLRELNCENNLLTSLDPMSEARLTLLDCRENRIASLEPLRHMPLRHLACCGNRITSLADVATVPLLWLDANHNAIADLSPLTGKLLLGLGIAANRVESLEPLRGAPLTHLHCDGNRIADLEPLKGMPMGEFECGGNPLTGLGPFATEPPPSFGFDCATIPGATLEEARSRWLADPRTANHALNAAILLALRTRDTDALRALATTFRTHRYLVIPVRLAWSAARYFCAGLGGHLVTIPDEDTDRFLRTLLRADLSSGGLWIGLSREAGHLQWVTGAGMDYSAVVADADSRHGNGCFVIGSSAYPRGWSIPAYLRGRRDELRFVLEWEA